MRSPYPNKAQRHLLLGAAGLAWLISTARHPAPSISVSLQTVSATLALSYLAIFLMGVTGDRMSLPFPPIGVYSKDHPGGCPEKLHPPYAPSQGSPKSLLEPHTRSAAGRVLIFGVHLDAQGESNLQESRGWKE